MRKKRRNYSSKEKVMLLKRHLVNKEEVSSICEEHGLHPNVFYKWQREFFENGEKAFEKSSR
ncbi:transposase, partial [bacterium]|nr:transposase [bacterium]